MNGGLRTARSWFLGILLPLLYPPHARTCSRLPLLRTAFSPRATARRMAPACCRALPLPAATTCGCRCLSHLFTSATPYRPLFYQLPAVDRQNDGVVFGVT